MPGSEVARRLSLCQWQTANADADMAARRGHGPHPLPLEQAPVQLAAPRVLPPLKKPPGQLAVAPPAAPQHLPRAASTASQVVGPQMVGPAQSKRQPIYPEDDMQMLLEQAKKHQPLLPAGTQAEMLNNDAASNSCN